MSIHVELNEIEAITVEVLVRQAYLALEDEIEYAEEGQDWETYETAMEEYNFFCDLADTIQMQMVDYLDEDDIYMFDDVYYEEEVYA